MSAFDILARPSAKLTKREPEQVKRIASELLDTPKAGRLRPARAAVFVVIQEVLENLPQIYSDIDDRVECDAEYQHVYDSYYGAGGSTHVVGPKRLSHN